MKALHVIPEGSKFRAIPISTVPMGESQIRSVNCPAACFKLHFRARSIPCLGPGCPLCPLPTRLTAVLPCKFLERQQLTAIQLPCVGPVEQLVQGWPEGWLVKIKRGGPRVRVVECEQSLHADVGAIKVEDLHESLTRMWGLPSPNDFTAETAWIAACFAAISRRL